MALRIETALATRLPRDADGRHHGFSAGDDIDLSDQQVQREICTRGWAGSEPDGVWSQEASAVLQFRISAGQDGPAAIWLAGMPFVTETHFQLIELACDGVTVGTVRLDWGRAGRQVLKLVRPDAGIGNPWIKIELRFLNRSSPAQEGVSGDSRPLGLKLGHVAFTGLDASPPPAFAGAAIVVAASPTVTPAPGAVARLEAQARALDAKLDLILDELDAIRAVAEQAERSAGRVAAALDRAIGAGEAR